MSDGAPVSSLSYLQVLKNRRLAVLLAGDVVSKIGDGMLVVALPLQTLRSYQGPQAALALAAVSAAPFVLAVLASFVFGLGRRRYRPRRALLADSALRALTVTALGVAALADALPLWVLATALVLGFGLRLLAASGRRLVAAEMGGDAGRFAVNGLLGTSDSLALYVLGPALGGPLAAAFGPASALLFAGAGYLALLAAVLLAVPPAQAASNPTDLAGAASGWSVLRRFPVAAWLFLVVFCFNLFYMPIEVALPLLVTGPLHGSSTVLGAIWTSFGVGALIGALATNQLRRIPSRLLLAGVIAGWSGCVAVLAAAPNTATAAVAMAGGGLVYAPFTPVAYSLMQSRLSPADQQPVITLWAAGTLLAVPIGLALGGPLVQYAGIRGGLLASLALTLALVPFSARLLRERRPAG